MMKTNDSPLSKALPITSVLLLATSSASIFLSLFQWMELLVVRAGGKTVCGINDTVNCEAVWSSAFAERMHGLTLVPVAGLGLVWSLVAFALALLLVHRQLSGAPIRVPVVALRITAAVGVAACITFAVASLRIGALCLTCLGTYALTLGFALIAFRLLPGPLALAPGEVRPALGWAVGCAVAGYLLILGPALVSAPAQSALPSASSGSSAVGIAELEQYLAGLPEAQKLAVSASLATYKASSTPDLSQYTTRIRKGPENAPVRIVEFTDTRCGHCAHLLRTLAELERVVPEGSISVEPRYFPLAKECNPLVQQPDPTGIRCAGAKAQLCLEGSPDYWRLRAQMFEEQNSLTPERVIEIASSGSVKREELVACMESPKTQEKINEDVAYAARFNPHGTPIVVVNGREGTPVGTFLYAMALTRGDANSPAFAKLPPPPAPESHEGHGH